MRWLVHSVWLLLAACGGDASPPPSVAAEQFAEGQAGINTADAHSSPIRSLVTVHQVDHPEGSAPSPPLAHLVSALDDPNPSVREDAIEALGGRIALT